MSNATPSITVSGQIPRIGSAKLAILAHLLVLAAICAGCVSAPKGDDSSGPSSRAGGRVRIGFAMATLAEERWNKDHELFKQRCESVGADCEVAVANGSSEKQLADVEQMLTRGVDVLVLAPHDAIQGSQIVDRAKAKGVPVISYDRLVNSDKIDVYISHQIPVVGRKIAEYAVSKVPRGNYVMVYGSNTDNNAKMIRDEQLKVLQPFIDRGEIRIVGEQFINDWRPELALNFAENALTRNSDDVQAFVVSNDGMASGVIKALEKKGLAGKVVVTGQDAQLNALQSIAEGRQSMTVYKPIAPLVNAAVETAIRLANRQPIEGASQFKANIDGKEFTVNALLLEVFPVERSNLMTTVIKDGYASYSDIFKNVPEGERPKN